MEKISLVLPTRGRPDCMERMWSSAVQLANNKYDLEICFYIDNDDTGSIEMIEKMRAQDDRVQYTIGPRICLSQAWNEAIKKATGEIYMHSGDDIVFRTEGWDDMVRRAFRQYPDRIALVFGPDGYQLPPPVGLGTHSFLHKNWIEATGYFLPPYFVSDYNDTWLNEVAQRIGRIHYLPDMYVEHMHFVVGKGPKDQTHLDRIERAEKDKPELLYKQKEPERIEDARKLLTYIDQFSR